MTKAVIIASAPAGASGTSAGKSMEALLSFLHNVRRDVELNFSLLTRAHLLPRQSVRFQRLFREGSRPLATKSHMIKVTPKNFENMVKSDKVVIFSKSNCCYSQAAKILFKDINMKYTAIELDRREDGPILQAHLGVVTGSMVVPRIFILGKFIGGYYDLVQLHENGTLVRLLKRD